MKASSLFAFEVILLGWIKGVNTVNNSPFLTGEDTEVHWVKRICPRSFNLHFSSLFSSSLPKKCPNEFLFHCCPGFTSLLRIKKTWFLELEIP